MATHGCIWWCCGIGWLVARVLHTQEPDGVGTLVRCRIAIEEIPNSLVQVTSPVLCSCQKRVGFALGRCMSSEDGG